MEVISAENEEYPIINELNRGLLFVGTPAGRLPTRAAPGTPVFPWKEAHNSLTGTTLFVSARKLAAAFWERLLYFSPPQNMQFGDDDRRLRRRLRRRGRGLNRVKDFEVEGDHADLDDPDHGYQCHHPVSARSLRRNIAEHLAQRSRSAERDSSYALRPLSPLSYHDLFLEMNLHNPPITPTSSIEFKEKFGDSTHGLEASTELLKVLNRIWRLEERHHANASLMKILKKELSHSRARIKELLQDQQGSRHAIEELSRQIADGKLSVNSKKEEIKDAAIQLVRDDLEKERKLRYRSESLCHKLRRELFQAKVGLSSKLKELEKERGSRLLFEKLCDAFSGTILEYGQHVHKGWTRFNGHDSMILGIAELWLHERMQIKDRDVDENGYNDSALDKIRDGLETFLQSRQVDTPRADGNLLTQDYRSSHLRCRSLESIPLNEALSAPKYVSNVDSALGGSHCSGMTNTTNVDFDSHQAVGESVLDSQKGSNTVKKSLFSLGRRKSRNQSSLRTRFEQKMGLLVNRNRGTDAASKGISGYPENSTLTADRKIEKKHNEGNGVRLNVTDGLSREPSTVHPSHECKPSPKENPSCRSVRSPIPRWMMRFPSPDFVVSSWSSKMPRVSKDDDSKAKVREGRPKVQRLKFLKGSS